MAGTLLTLQAAYKNCALNMGQRPSDMKQSNSRRKDLPVNKLPNIDSYIIVYFATWRSATKVNFQRLQTFSQLQNRGQKKKGTACLALQNSVTPREQSGTMLNIC